MHGYVATPPLVNLLSGVRTSSSNSSSCCLNCGLSRCNKTFRMLCPILPSNFMPNGQNLLEEIRARMRRWKKLQYTSETPCNGHGSGHPSIKCHSQEIVQLQWQHCVPLQRGCAHQDILVYLHKNVGWSIKYHDIWSRYMKYRDLH